MTASQVLTGLATSNVSQQQAEESSETIKIRHGWIAELFMHLAYNRKIELSDERREYFMRTMHEEKLTEYQYKKAKDWIMYGDWTMRGADPTVTLEDFYPTGQMMDSVRNRQIMMQREQPSKGQPMSNDEFKAFQKRYLDTDGFKQ